MQKRDAVFLKLARRHLIPKRDSVVDLTFRLRSNPQEVKMQAAQASCRPHYQRNSALLRNLSDAVKAPLAYRQVSTCRGWRCLYSGIIIASMGAYPGATN